MVRDFWTSACGIFGLFWYPVSRLDTFSVRMPDYPERYVNMSSELEPVVPVLHTAGEFRGEK